MTTTATPPPSSPSSSAPKTPPVASARMSVDGNTGEGGFATLRRGLRLSPEIFDGVGITLVLALAATLGKVVIPITIQQVIDVGILKPATPDLHFVVRTVLIAVVLLVITTTAQVFMNRRLFRATESGLATLRIRAFRHVHDLSLLTQGTERRGSLVSRVTSDVDTISQFISFGGIMLIVNLAQLIVATVVMATYSWQLTLVVWACFLPTLVLMRYVQLQVRAAYAKVRVAIGAMLGAVSESLVGAATVRAYGISERTLGRMDDSVDDVHGAQKRVLRPQALSFSLSELVDGFTVTMVIIVGVSIGAGAGGHVTLGRLLAFLFLVTLFTMPIRMGIEILNEAQNAIAGWRRVLGVLDTPADISDPADTGVPLAVGVGTPTPLPLGPLGIEVRDLRFAYPDGPDVLKGVSISLPPRSRVAVVGETGSGKTTFAKLLTRLMDPKSGTVSVGGLDLRQIPFASLRSRVVMVPQEGFLFDTTIAENLRYGLPDATPEQMLGALTELGLTSWVNSLSEGLETPVGQRGEFLSAGERQLVALARAYVADPDLLVLDEATSAVDPAADVALQAAIDSIARGRTTVTIAHRLSTAEAADLILVFAEGELVEIGPHDRLVSEGGIYAGLHTSWVSARER